MFLCFWCKKCVLDTSRFFSQFWGCTECSWGWAHMQSVHVYAVQTHFSLLCIFHKKGCLKSPTWANFGTIFSCKCDSCVKKEASKNASKKGVLLKSHEPLFTGQEAPGEAASRAHCTDKKQLFEQQLKHCSRFLQKKVDWAQNWCEKLTGLLNRGKQNWKGYWNLLTVETRVETGSVETIVETNVQGLWSDTPWAKARRIWTKPVFYIKNSR